MVVVLQSEHCPASKDRTGDAIRKNMELSGLAPIGNTAEVSYMRI